MRKLFVFFLIFTCWQECHAQDMKVNSIGIAVPVIWNKSYGVYYALGTRKEPEGKAKSFGVHLHYNRSFNYIEEFIEERNGLAKAETLLRNNFKKLFVFYF